jgi:hypothetical protein
LAWFGLQLRLLTAQPTLGLGYLHSFSGAESDQVRFELRHHRQDIEQQPPDWIGWIMDRAAEAELDISPRELIENVTGVRQRPGEPVQLRHHQRVTRPTRGKRQPQTGSVAVSAGQPVIDADTIITNAERVQRCAGQ